MTQIAFIQARMSSRRLPGKVLAPLHGRPMLQYLVERLRRCEYLGDVAVLTSSATEDDALEAFCLGAQLRCFRGSLDDVMGRFLACAAAFGVEAFVRVNGDSPLLVPALVDRAIAEFERSPADVVCNAFPRSFPKGQSVEVVSAAALAMAARQTHDADDREHVTKYFYAHPDRFRIRNLSNDRNLQSIQMSVDTVADFAKIASMLSRMDRPHCQYGLDELVALERQHALT